MSTFAEIKVNIKNNAGNSNFFGDTEVDDVTQDAYDEVVALSQCIVKKINLPFQSGLNYYNFRDAANFPDIYVEDLIAVTAIFSNLTNLWLLDSLALKDFDNMRIDWENWVGASVWWAPTNDFRRVAIIPKPVDATDSTFDLYYWAKAPTVDDNASPLVPPDFENLIELHATASLLEGAEEFYKAKLYWDEFWGTQEDGSNNLDDGIFALATRSKNIAKSDLLMLG